MLSVSSDSGLDCRSCGAAQRPRGRDPQSDRPRPIRQGNCANSLHLAGDGQIARQAHIHQAQRPEAGTSRFARATSRTRRHSVMVAPVIAAAGSANPARCLEPVGGPAPVRGRRRRRPSCGHWRPRPVWSAQQQTSAFHHPVEELVVQPRQCRGLTVQERGDPPIAAARSGVDRGRVRASSSASPAYCPLGWIARGKGHRPLGRPARHHQVCDQDLHGVAVLAQRGRPEFDQKQVQAEDARWEKQKERLETVVRRARD